MNSRNTDLEQAKLVAHALLEVEIQPTEFSPMIVSHPFTNTGVVFFPDEQGNFTQADLLNQPTDLDRWRKRVGEQIDKAKNVSQIFMLLNKPYYLTFIKYAAPCLSEKDLGQLLSDAWIMSEFPNADRNVGTRELLALFKSVSPEYLMDQKDWQRYQSLGDPVTVYRGVASADKGNVKACPGHWTERLRSGLLTDSEKTAPYTRPKSKRTIYAPTLAEEMSLKLLLTPTGWKKSWWRRGSRYGRP